MDKKVGLAVAAGLALALWATRAGASVKEYKCTYCGETFASLTDLQQHVGTVHPGERIPIEVTWE